MAVTNRDSVAASLEETQVYELRGIMYVPEYVTRPGQPIRYIGPGSIPYTVDHLLTLGAEKGSLFLWPRNNPDVKTGVKEF